LAVITGKLLRWRLYKFGVRLDGDWLASDVWLGRSLKAKSNFLKEMNATSPKILKFRGPETAFVSEIMTVIDRASSAMLRDRHAEELTVHQICGGLFAAATQVLVQAETD
jgi:hypothetical protein